MTRVKLESFGRYGNTVNVFSTVLDGAAVARGDADAHQCEVCHRVAAVREVVPLYDDAVLVCLGCASLLKYQRQEAA